ncbi:hypothetical protein NDU88_004292 [Pleurodeles waltl]|uniref:Uncharacterized protein n=1 Tax=Pleurodeles waltl TaxID=8319 RepID=A0AAV7TRK2_PLEWA|nr:hypothetical protein NDU88_004292 [Pleurodeles waltl]
MATSKHKKEQSVQEMPTRSTPAQYKPADNTLCNNKGVSVEEHALVFLTSLFDSLKTDLQDLRKDLSQDMRNLCSDLTSIGEQVSGLEDIETARYVDVEQLRQEFCDHRNNKTN